MLHETGIFTTTIYRKFKPNVGRYSSLMEHTCLVWERFSSRVVSNKRGIHGLMAGIHGMPRRGNAGRRSSFSTEADMTSAMWTLTASRHGSGIDRQLPSPKLTASSPLKNRLGPQKGHESSNPNHPFVRGKLAVSCREVTVGITIQLGKTNPTWKSCTFPNWTLCARWYCLWILLLRGHIFSRIGCERLRKIAWWYCTELRPKSCQ